jgi:thiol:disulfide interchange protein DsbC
MNRLFFLAFFILSFVRGVPAYAVSLDQFKKQVNAEYSGTVLATQFDEVIRSSVVTVKGDGSRKLIVFTDPYCKFCKDLEKNLIPINNVTIYRLLMPMEGVNPGANQVSTSIFCSNNPSQSIADWYQQAKLPEVSSKPCNAPLPFVKILAQSVRAYGTPTIIFANGYKSMGSMATEHLEIHLNR